MKKIFLFYVFIMTSSCALDNSIEDTNSKNINNNNLRLNIDNSSIAKSISEEQSFIILVNEMEDFNNFIQEIIENNNLDLQNVQIELNNLKNLNLNYQDQIEKINLIFNSNVEQRYNVHIDVFNNNWYYIYDKYKIDDVEILEEAYFNVLQKNLSTKTGCGWRYNLCIGAAAAGAILCHAGCDTTALATTAGLGIPACIWACGTLQVAASVQCYDTYCN